MHGNFFQNDIFGILTLGWKVSCPAKVLVGLHGCSQIAKLLPHTPEHLQLYTVACLGLRSC